MTKAELIEELVGKTIFDVTTPMNNSGPLRIRTILFTDGSKLTLCADDKGCFISPAYVDSYQDAPADGGQIQYYIRANDD